MQQKEKMVPNYVGTEVLGEGENVWEGAGGGRAPKAQMNSEEDTL